MTTLLSSVHPDADQRNRHQDEQNKGQFPGKRPRESRPGPQRKPQANSAAKTSQQQRTTTNRTQPSYLLDAETIGKRYLHHCSLRREDNSRTEDKLITPMKKGFCQLSLFSHTQARGDPSTNLVRAKKTKIKSRNGKRNNQDSP